MNNSSVSFIPNTLALTIALLISQSAFASPPQITLQEIGAPINGNLNPNIVGVDGAGRAWVTTNETNAGIKSWIYNGNQTIQVGLTGSSYTDSHGYGLITFSNNNSNYQTNFFNQSGQAIGTSQQYDSAGNNLGQSAWIYNGAQTVKIGLFDAAHINFAGGESNVGYQINNQGQVLGSCYNCGSNNGLHEVWIYDGQQTKQIGLTGTGYVDSYHNGGPKTNSMVGPSLSYSYPVIGNSYFNNAGQAIGVTQTYDAVGNSKGPQAWVYNGSQTIAVGLSGAQYVNANGFKNSAIYDLNNAGKAVGYQSTYGTTGGVSVGADAFLYDGNNSVKLSGLTGANNNAFSSAVSINDAGDVVGNTGRAVGQSNKADTWIYHGGQTKQIGLTGSGYTAADGTADSRLGSLNEAGQAVGFNYLYNQSDSVSHGVAAWFYDGNQTKQVGLKGVGFISKDGYAESQAAFLNNAGQVAGSSILFDAAQSSQANGNFTSLGQAAWFYDSSTSLLVDLTMDRTHDGHASSTVRYLGLDGTVIGDYTLFDDATDAVLGTRSFYYKMGVGLFDLESLVTNPKAGAFSLNVADPDGQLGVTYTNGNIVTTYVATLSPVSSVPVPAAAWLFGSGLLGLTGLARKRKTV